jgi:DEAD/DEAH box helicase domain-containing protein
MLSDEVLTKIYHSIIIELEAPRIAQMQVAEGKWYTISDVWYSISRDELRNFLRGKGISEPDKVIDTLINKGFIVELPEKWSEKSSSRLRTLHMDVLVRSSQITTMYGGLPYILSPKFALTKIKVPVKSDRIILPSPATQNGSDKKHWNSILAFFNNDDKLAKIYADIIKEYLGSSGLDAFQAYVLCDILFSNEDVYAIVAPTGSGKTEIYLFYMLAYMLKWRVQEGNRSRKILLVYPRRTLTVDQSYRIIKLLDIANAKLQQSYSTRITFVIRDGSTPRSPKEIKDRSLFRGVGCPRCNRGSLRYSRQKGVYSIVCDSCNHTYDFIKVSRDEAGDADIIATNPWAFEVRLIDSASGDANVHTIADAGIIIFDEVHEYTGISGGILAQLIQVVRNISNTDKKFIFSSATIPNPQDFISKISGVLKPKVYNSVEEVQKGRINITGERLVILSYLIMNPRYSWNTYCQLWSVYMAFLNYAYEQQKAQSRQAILFVNNIRELRRVHSGCIETLRLGEPKDHLVSDLDSLDPYTYWHYLPANIREHIYKRAITRELFEDLNQRITEIHSEVPEENRSKVINALKAGKGIVVLSTSALEVGVDYENVSFILNVGVDNPVSLIQRIGRGGRSIAMLRTVLGILLVRAIPTEMFKIYDEEFKDSLASLAPQGYTLFVTYSNPQIIKRGLLIEAIARLAGKGLETHASGRSGGTLTQNNITKFVNNVLRELS